MKTLQLAMIITLSLSVIFLITSQHVFADTCSARLTSYNAPQFYLLSDGVFAGTVQHIDSTIDHQWKVYFTVDKLWRGSISQKPLMVMTNDLQGCGYSIVQGEKYLVYTNGYPPFFNTVWSKPYADAQSDISIIDDPKFQSNEKFQEELNKKLEIARDAISNLMVNNTSGIPFNMVGVDEINSTLDVGIDSTKATLSEAQYLKKINEIVGDIPIKITFGQIQTTANSTDDNSRQNNSPLPIMPPLKQLESGIISDQVKCSPGLQLIFKQENMSPICVKPETSKILIERGWATPIPGISFGGPTNIINDTQLKPKVTLSDYSYDGIDKDNTTVSINNQTYYQTTLDYADYDLKKGTLIQFQNVTFAFPQGVMTTPGGAFIMLDMKFQDGSQETYGENKINPDGSGEGGGIQIPTQYGPSSAKNSITVLSNHLNPQAGLTIYNDKIKLLVSTDNQASSVLKLSLVTNSKAIHYGESIWMEISVSNTLPVPFMALTKNDWKFNASSLNVCSSSPVGISILNGYYTEENMTEGKQLSLYNNNINCPYVLNEVTGYQFEPSGNKILSCSTNTNDSCSDHEMRYQVSFSGYWSDNLHPFDIGTYTVIGADEWGHVAIEHFVVTNPESISITPENSQTLSINKNNGIVTGTRIIDINMNDFHQSRSPMTVQVYYPNDTLYSIDKIPSTSIQPDGFYKYNFTMSSSDANAVYGNHRIIVTYNDQTVETIASIAVPP